MGTNGRIWAVAVLATLGLGAGAASASAATLTWTAAVNNDWSNAGNWTPSQAPASGDDLVLTPAVNASMNNDLAPAIQLGSVTVSNNSNTFNITVTGNPIALLSGGSITDNSTLARSNGITPEVALNGPATIAATGASPLELGGPITGAGDVTFTNSTGVSPRLTIDPVSPSTYSGATTIGGNATVTLTPNAVPGNSAVTVLSGATAIAAGSATYGSLSGAGVVVAGGAASPVTSTLAVGGDGSSATFSGVLEDAPINGTLALAKTGAGTFTLAGANTYTGDTFVNEGTLSVTGSVVSTTTVALGTKLAGTGTVGPVIALGTVAPGTSVGTLSTDQVNFGGSATYAAELATASSDLIDASGTVNLNGADLDLSLAPGYEHVAGTVFTIVESDNPVLGTFDGPQTIEVGGHRFRVDYPSDRNEVRLVAARATPGISGDASGPVMLGGRVSDSATLTGGLAPTGQVTFRLYGPGNASCSGSPAFTDTKAVSGNGSYVSGNFKPSEAGTYRWTASTRATPTTTPQRPPAPPRPSR